MTSSSVDRRGLAYVVLAVLMFSTSPVLIRWAFPVSAFEITFWRMVIASATVAVLAWLGEEPIHLPLADLQRFALFGLVAALHFLFYIASLAFTTVAHSLSIVYTAPVFITIFSALFLKEPLSQRKYLGIVIVVMGVAILAGFEPQFSARMFTGDLLALGSAIMFGIYSVIGRSQRHRYPLLTYALGVYSFAALWSLPIAVASWTPTYTAMNMVALTLLGVFPLGIGHTLYNAAIRRVHATYANVIATQEVTGGILLSLVVLGEVPSLSAVVGAAVTLIGIVLVVL